MMYHKFEGDREVFSTCDVITLGEFQYSNPTPELIAEAGWEPYTPPVIPQTEPSEFSVVEAVKKLLKTTTDSLTDEDALEVASAFPTWISMMGKEVAVGARLWYDGDLWKVILAHTAQIVWTPSTSPSLYVKVSIVEWPEWVQPVGSTDAYMAGDKVTHNNKHWISSVDGNVWEPGAVGSESLWTEA